MSYIHKQLTVLKAVVESETEITLNWFDDNQMRANPGTFQAIVGSKRPGGGGGGGGTLIFSYIRRLGSFFFLEI